jgi:hypothetical protein
MDSRGLLSSKSSFGSLSAHHHLHTFVASTLGDSLTDKSWSVGQGPILQAYPFCDSTPEAGSEDVLAANTLRDC